MKTKILLFFALMFSFGVNAQIMHYFYVNGGVEGKNYAAIIETNLPKVDLINQTSNILARYWLIDTNDLKAQEITEDMSEYSLPITFRQSQVAGKGLMGAKYLDCPIKLHGQLRFEFHEKNVMIVFENFTSDVLAANCTFGFEKKTMTKYEEEYFKEKNLLLTKATVIGRFLIAKSVEFDKAQLNALNKTLENYFEDINTRFHVYDKMVEEGSAFWMTSKEFAEWYGTHTAAQANAPYIQKAVDEGKMLGVSKQRWSENLLPLFDNLFIYISKSLNGNISGVAEDGIKIWELENDNLLPTDPKLRKKYIKKGWDYYNQGQ